MKVIEIFKSINGEGLKQGELALFIRLANCNLRCRYCDTAYSFTNPLYKEMTYLEIVKEAKEANINNITITGGEPLIHKDVALLIKELSNEGFNIEIETNGSVDILPFLNISNVSFTLDFKTLSSNESNKMYLKNYDYITKKDSIKFVCGSIADSNQTKDIIDKYDLINKTNCIISPIFGDIDPKDIVSFMLENNLNGVRLALQIHKFIWNKDQRGV